MPKAAGVADDQLTYTWAQQARHVPCGKDVVVEVLALLYCCCQLRLRSATTMTSPIVQSSNRIPASSSAFPTAAVLLPFASPS